MTDSIPPDVEPRDADIERLMRLLVEWMRQPNWTDSRQFLEDHPELLREPTTEAMDGLAARLRAQGRAEELEMLEGHRRLLADTADTGGTELYEGLELQDLVRRLEQLGDGSDDRPLRLELLRRAAAIAPRAKLPELWASLHGNLAIALMEDSRAEEGPDAEQAMACFRAALEVFQRDSHPLDWAQTMFNLSRAIEQIVSREQYAPRLSDDQLLAAKIQAIECDQGAREVEPGLPQRVTIQRMAQEVGLRYLTLADWERAVRFLWVAHRTYTAIYPEYLGARDREWAIGETAELTAALAYALVRCGWQDAALRAANVLESGRARMASVAMQHQQDLSNAAAQLPEELYLRLHAATMKIDRLAVVRGRPTTPGQTKGVDFDELLARVQAGEGAEAEYGDVVTAIRERAPDFEFSTITDPPAGLLAAAGRLAGSEGLVFVAHSVAGAVAILVRGSPSDADGVSAAGWCDQRFTTGLVTDLLERHEPAPSDRVVGGLLPAQYGIGRLSEAVGDAIRVLGDSDGVLSELARVCRETGLASIVLIPCGLFGLLPLHAALVEAGANGDQPQPLLDIVRVGYSSSAWMWGICRDRAQRTAGEGLNALVVGNPMPPPPRAKPLSGAGEEASAVAGLTAKVAGSSVTRIEAEAATRAAVVETLQGASPALTHAHFACHAEASLYEPQRSALLLSNGERFAVEDLLEPGSIRFRRLRLTVLSACQTGVLGTDLPDESMGLPGSWLQAGSAGVVASLWPVSDEWTVALMTKFYELHLLEAIEPGEALWLAQRWLRGLPTWRNDFDQSGALQAAGGPEAPDVARGLASMLGLGKSRRRSPDERTDNPLYWAAFVMYGS